jgi:hypothetical protein
MSIFNKKNSTTEPDLPLTKKQSISSKWISAIVSNKYPLCVVEDGDLKSLMLQTNHVSINTIKITMKILTLDDREFPRSMQGV